MGELIFTGSYKPLTEQDIRNFEQWLEAPLPKKYRKFLLGTNGGHPHKHLLSECYLEGFYALTTANKRSNLQREILKMQDDLPAGLISVGYAGNGDRICLSLTGGEIYLWQHDRRYESQPPKLEELIPLADDIDELLGKLEGDDPPVPDDEVSNLGRWGDVGALADYLKQGHDINEVSPQGSTILQAAAYAGHLDFIKECVKRGAILKGRDLLHAAAFTMDHEMMKYLLQQGLDPNELDDLGGTPLDCVPLPDFAPVAQLLKSKGGRKAKQ
jgi:hypothetical protein